MLKVSLALAAAMLAPAATVPSNPEWVEPIAPFRIADGLYYVGSRDLAAYLIDGGKEGLILLDAGMPEFAPRVLASIRDLGFDPKRVRILINSQAHADHAGGIAAIREETGAKLLVSAADTPLMERGGRDDFAFGDDLSYPPAKVDGTVHDGDRVTIGAATLTAHITPGHTRGCTSWTMPLRIDGAERTALFICGTSAPGYRLVDNPAYPTIMKDFRSTFARLRALPCDVFLGSHGVYFGLDAKRARVGAAPNPFIDPEGCRTFIDRSERALEAQAAKQAVAER